MAASPHVLVRDGSGSYVNPDSTGDLNYPNGVNVTPGNTISIRLVSADSVGQWNLRVVGTDEETTHPTLTGVDISTGVVSTASTVVTFTVPAGVAGRTYIFQSVVNNGGPAYTITFGIYTLTGGGFRVGAVGERFENDATFGWTRTLNQFIKHGGSTGTVPSNRRVIAGTGILGGGDLTADRTFSIDFGSSSGQVTQGNDSRLSNDRTASGLRTATTVVAVSAATSPTIGQVLTATSSTGATWQSPSSGPSWHTILDLDFTTQSTQSITGDGAIVIGGITFYFENYANRYSTSTASVTNGTGLVLPCNDSGRDYHTLRDAPLLRWPFPASVINGVPVRAAIRVGLDTGWAGEAFLGVEYPSSSSPRNLKYVRGNVDSSATVMSTYGCGILINNSHTTSISNNVCPTNADLIGITLPLGIGAPMPMGATAGRFSDGVYSNLNNMAPIFFDGSLRNSDTTDAMTIGNASNWGIALSTRFSSLGVNYHLVIRSVKVDAFY